MVVSVIVTGRLTGSSADGKSMTGLKKRRQLGNEWLRDLQLFSGYVYNLLGASSFLFYPLLYGLKVDLPDSCTFHTRVPSKYAQSLRKSFQDCLDIFLMVVGKVKIQKLPPFFPSHWANFETFHTELYIPQKNMQLQAILSIFWLS